jgi:hemolysin III
MKDEKINQDLLAPLKPLLRGWSHALAAVAAVILTIWLCVEAAHDGVRLFSVVIFGVTMILLYTVSAVYHIGRWSPRRERFLRSFDHANIFALIAGTYTPFCLNMLSGWARAGLLAAVWGLAVAGILASIRTHLIPRSVRTGLYVAIGWVAVLASPAIAEAAPLECIVVLLLGGGLYTVGAVIYGWRWPNPSPRYFGFHEIFHLFVIAGGIAFTVAVYVWALPYPRA